VRGEGASRHLRARSRVWRRPPVSAGRRERRPGRLGSETPLACFSAGERFYLLMKEPFFSIKNRAGLGAFPGDGGP
jgi:hypothetical protein